MSIWRSIDVSYNNNNNNNNNNDNDNNNNNNKADWLLHYSLLQVVE